MARFVGDFRDRDRAVIAELGLDDRVELIPYLPRHEALALQRDSDALLLLVPTGEGRGRFVVTTKIFEYLAAGRPILAAVPEDGAAAALLRETGPGWSRRPRTRAPSPRRSPASSAPGARDP